jgi:hypothetical protein
VIRLRLKTNQVYLLQFELDYFKIKKRNKIIFGQYIFLSMHRYTGPLNLLSYLIENIDCGCCAFSRVVKYIGVSELNIEILVID